MNDIPILTALFSLEYAIIASVAAAFFYKKTKKLAAALIRAQNQQDDKGPNFAELIEQQIMRTRKRIAGHLRAANDPAQKKSAELLNKRVELLELEKDVADDKIEEQSYWQIICDRLNSIVSIAGEKTNAEDEQEKPKPEIVETSVADEAAARKYKESILNYQQQLASLHEEFQNFRKTAHRAVNLSSAYEGDDTDSALSELMADFKDHDERLQERLKQLENENKKLTHELAESETEVMSLDHQLKSTPTAAPENDEAAPTASEEEIKRLRGIINRQYGSLDELRMALMQTETTEEESQQMQAHLDAVEKSQKELEGCIQVLESENDRLLEELEKAKSHGTPERTETSKKELDELYNLRLETKADKEKIVELDAQLAAKDEALEKMSEEFDSMQSEFMRMYEQQGG